MELVAQPLAFFRICVGAGVFAAAGSLVVLLVWVYFSAQIFLLGAEFTWVYSHEYGSRTAQSSQKSALIVPSHTGGGK